MTTDTDTRPLEDIAGELGDTAPDNVGHIHETDDNDAPYGYTNNGQARRKPGRKPGAKASGGSPFAPPKSPPRRAPRTPRTQAPDYRPALSGIAQFSAAALSVFLPMDAAAIVIHSPGIIEAANETAKAHPSFAAMLDKIMIMGPYGALVGAMLPLLAQIADNHQILPTTLTRTLGAVSHEQLLSVFGTPAPAGN